MVRARSRDELLHPGVHLRMLIHSPANDHDAEGVSYYVHVVRTRVLPHGLNEIEEVQGVRARGGLASVGPAPLSVVGEGPDFLVGVSGSPQPLPHVHHCGRVLLRFPEGGVLPVAVDEDHGGASEGLAPSLTPEPADGIPPVRVRRWPEVPGEPHSSRVPAPVGVLEEDPLVSTGHASRRESRPEPKDDKHTNSDPETRIPPHRLPPAR